MLRNKEYVESLIGLSHTKATPHNTAKARRVRWIKILSQYFDVFKALIKK